MTQVDGDIIYVKLCVNYCFKTVRDTLKSLYGSLNKGRHC